MEDTESWEIAELQKIPGRRVVTGPVAKGKPLSAKERLAAYNRVLKEAGSPLVLKKNPGGPVTLNPAQPVQGVSYLSLVNGLWTPLTMDETGTVVTSTGDIMLVNQDQPVNIHNPLTWESYLSAVFRTVPGKTYAMEFLVSDDDTRGTWQFYGDATAVCPTTGTTHTIITGFRAQKPFSGTMLFYQRKPGEEGSGTGCILSVTLVKLD